MCVCVCVSVCVCVCACVCVCMCVYLCVCVYDMFVYTCMCVCLCLCECVCLHCLFIRVCGVEILVVSSSRLRPTGDMSLHIGNTTVDVSNTVKNLGVYFDQTLSMSDHVRRVCQIANFHLRNISHVRKYLTEDACNHAVRSLVLSRLDYGNSLLANIAM